MPKTQAIVIEKAGQAVQAEVSVPKLREDYILVKVKAFALNPTDWKHVDFLASKGARVSYMLIPFIILYSTQES